MKQAYRRWVCGLLAAVLALLAFCAALVYTVDPCLYYRMPETWDPVFFSERYQAAGLVRNVLADTVVLGTSMVANYRAGQVAGTFGGPAVRVTLPDGYFSEFDQVMTALYRKQNPKRVVFGLDANILMRDEDGGHDAVMPDYLYNENPLDDVKYLLNKDTLYYSLYVLMANRWGQGQTLDEGFTWDGDIWWNHMTALEEYQRPEIATQQLAAEAYAGQVEENLQVVTGWLAAHPDTEFDIFFPPYSLLYWDKTIRQGHTDAVFAALEQACRTLLRYDNVRLFGFLFDREITEDLDNYCDYVHHSGQVCTEILQKMAAGEMELTAESWEKTLANWREFVVHYDYDKFWTDAFWWKWNIDHGAPVVWKPAV